MRYRNVKVGDVLVQTDDVVIDRHGVMWQARNVVTASGENTVAFAGFGTTYVRYAEQMAAPIRHHEDVVPRLLDTERNLIEHSVFAYPHFRLWHMMFDGTRLCRCWHSREMKSLGH